MSLCVHLYGQVATRNCPINKCVKYQIFRHHWLYHLSPLLTHFADEVQQFCEAARGSVFSYFHFLYNICGARIQILLGFESFRIVRSTRTRWLGIARSDLAQML